jgi:hypothetical protein
MHLTASKLLLCVSLFFTNGCVNSDSSPPVPEHGDMSKSGSRIPAPTVEPVRNQGVRYEQVKNGLLAGFDQMGGYLAAYDDTSGRELWTLKVYDNKRNPEREGDVQDVFFKSMILLDDGSLMIENERGARFKVDPATRSVTPAP